MTGPVTARRLTPADVPAYRDLRLRALQDHPDAFSSAYEDEAVEPLDFFARRIWTAPSGTFGGFSGAILAGIATLIVPDKLKMRHRGELAGIYVAPEYQRSGIARPLVQATIAAARDAGVVSLRLTVNTRNVRAEQFYRTLGFRSYGVDKRMALIGGVYHDATMMGLELD